jgi:hypothetical protein
MAQLTGNHRYRSNWRGQLILQVEEAVRHSDLFGSTVHGWTVTKWRDATLFDLQTEWNDQ